MEHFVVTAFYSILAFAVGLGSWFFLPSHMREKGKNLATKEDIQELARQTRTLTQTTKEIEARISIGVWSKQQRWDLQKTALLDSLKELATAETFLVRLVQTFADTKDQPAGVGDPAPGSERKICRENQQFLANAISNRNCVWQGNWESL